MRNSFFLLGLILLLVSQIPALASASIAQEEPADQEGGDPKPRLLDIARSEAAKQQLKIQKMIRETLQHLGIYTDPNLEYVQQKISEVAGYGATAVPLLLEAMRNPSKERTPVNAGRMAAVILAKISDDRIDPAIHHMLTEENTRARINALLYLGRLGTPRNVEQILALLEHENSDLKSQALICLGLMKVPQTLEFSKKYLQSNDTTLHLAAIHALSHFGSARGEELILPVFSASGVVPVVDAGIEFLYWNGTMTAVPALIDKYAGGTLKKKQRWSIIKALASIGEREGTDASKPIIEFLKGQLDSPDIRTIKKLALALNALGDDTGLKVRTRQLDRLISKHSSADYYFRRGEIYMEFKKYKQAARDFNEGLRKDRKGGRYGAQVFVSLARCYAAEERFADAERTLRKAELEDTTRLPIDYEEFTAMAEDTRYAKVFKPGWR